MFDLCVFLRLSRLLLSDNGGQVHAVFLSCFLKKPKTKTHTHTQNKAKENKKTQKTKNQQPQKHHHHHFTVLLSSCLT